MSVASKDGGGGYGRHGGGYADVWRDEGGEGGVEEPYLL